MISAPIKSKLTVKSTSPSPSLPLQTKLSISSPSSFFPYFFWVSLSFDSPETEAACRENEHLLKDGWGEFSPKTQFAPND